MKTDKGYLWLTIGLCVAIFIVFRIYGIANPGESLFENQTALLSILASVLLVLAVFARAQVKLRRRIDFPEVETLREESPTFSFMDNISSLEAEEALSIIRNFFASELISFVFLEERRSSNGDWEVKYVKENTIVFLSTENKKMNFYIEESGQKFLLYYFDYRLQFLQTPSRKNLEFLLERLKAAISSREQKYPLQVSQ